MANSVKAILDGFDYQALWFWFYVCDMLSHEAEVDQVGFEVEEYEAFDDVAIRYVKPLPDGDGGAVTGKFYSIKLSVSYGKEISIEVIDDPSLINATSRSLLQRLADAVKKMEKENASHLFVLAAPWGLKSGDVIQGLVNTANGSLRLKKLFDGTGPRGQMGKIRDRWRKHLGLTTDEELRPILSRIRFDLRYQTQEAHIEQLSLQLMGVKIRRILKEDMAAKHFRIPFALSGQGKRWLARGEIIDICKSQDLLLKDEIPKRNAKQLGLRAFMPLAEGLGQKVDHLLCVVDEFAGRVPKQPNTWLESVPKRMSSFLSDVVRSEHQYDLHLHCFGSMAFLAGHLLEPGLGVSAGIVQRSYGKPPVIWTVNEEDARAAADPWAISVEQLGAGEETAVAISLTNPTVEKVREYCLKSLPQVGRLIHAVPVSGVSHQAVKSGTEAYVLASCLKNRLGSLPQRTGPLHLYWSAPNAFAFYFGQLARTLGVSLTYEFDFETQQYSPAMRVSPAARLVLNESRQQHGFTELF